MKSRAGTPGLSGGVRRSFLVVVLLITLVQAWCPPVIAGRPPVIFPPSDQDFPQGARSRQWQKVWGDSGPAGHVAVRDLPANGGRPVAIFVPAAFDPERPARAVTYFHGHDGNVGSYFASTGVLARIQFLCSGDANVVFVCPEAAAKPFGYWMTSPKESFAGLTRQALGMAARLAGRPITIRQRIVSAHSGGGLALRNAVTTGQMAADRLEFLDSNYSDWGAVIANWSAAQPAGQQVPIETYNTPGPTRTHDAEIKAAHPDLVTVNESPVGHFEIPGRLLGFTLTE